MSNVSQEHGVAGETAEQVYDGAHFLAKYIEVAEAAHEAKRLRKIADGITNENIAKLMDPETDEPLYSRSSQIPPHLAEELALGSLEALVYRSRAEFFSRKAANTKSDFATMYVEHYLDRKIRITARENQDRSPIQKLGVGSAGKHLSEVTGKLSPRDVDALTHMQPRLNIRGGIDWYRVDVLDRETLEQLIDIETLK